MHRLEVKSKINVYVIFMVKILICVLQVQSNIQNCSGGKEIWPNLNYHSCSKGPLKEIIRYMQVKMKFSRFMLCLCHPCLEVMLFFTLLLVEHMNIILTMNLTPLKEHLFYKVSIKDNTFSTFKK